MRITFPVLILAASLSIDCVSELKAQSPILIRKAEDFALCSEAQLEALFASGYVNGIPVGRMWGMPLINPGSPGAVPASLGGRVVWSGKRIEAENVIAVNRFFGLPLIRAEVRIEPSLRDSRPAIVLDYSGHSFLYRNVRDEIREISPGLYLGYMDDLRTAQPAARRWFVVETAR